MLNNDATKFLKFASPYRSQPEPPEVTQMWSRIEGSDNPCRCGGVAEMWARLTEVKPAVRIVFCRTCHPHLANLVGLANLVSPPTPIVGDDGEEAA